MNPTLFGDPHSTQRYVVLGCIAGALAGSIAGFFELPLIPLATVAAAIVGWIGGIDIGPKVPNKVTPLGPFS